MISSKLNYLTDWAYIMEYIIYFCDILCDLKLLETVYIYERGGTKINIFHIILSCKGNLKNYYRSK